MLSQESICKKAGSGNSHGIKPDIEAQGVRQKLGTRLGIQEIKTQNADNIFREIITGQRVKREIWQFAKLLRSKIPNIIATKLRNWSQCVGRSRPTGAKRHLGWGRLVRQPLTLEFFQIYHEILIPSINSMIQHLFAWENDVFLRRGLPCRHYQTVKLSVAFVVHVWLKRMTLSLPSFVPTAEQSILWLQQSSSLNVFSPRGKLELPMLLSEVQLQKSRFF